MRFSITVADAIHISMHSQRLDTLITQAATYAMQYDSIQSIRSDYETCRTSSNSSQNGDERENVLEKQFR